MLQFLFSPTKQFLYDSGNLLAGGKIYVYLKDTQILATLYDGETGEGKPNPIVLDANGRASVKADDVNEYRLEIYTPYDTLVYTCNAFYAEGGEGGGTFIVRHDETLSGNGTSQNPLSVVNIPLAVDDTMTAYTDIVEGVSSLVLGVNGDWFNDTFGSALNDKVDWSSFSACCSSVKEELKNKLDSSSFDLSNYYNKQETNNLFENYYNKQEIDETVNVINELKQDKLTFDYNENSAISAINGSALAGQGGGEGSCPWITGGKEITNTQTLTGDMIVQVLSSFTLSGDHNHFISVKGGVYRFPNKLEIASGIAETNYFMPQSGMSSYLPISTFSSYTASIQDNLNTNWDYTNSAYSLSINNLHNKLDSSAFSAYTADQGNTYTLVGGDLVSISSDDEAETTTISVTGVPGQGEIDNVVNTLSSFSGSWNESTTVVQTNSAAWYDGNTEVNSYVQNNSATINNITNTVESNSAQWAKNDGDSAVNEVVRNFSANGTWLTAHQDLSDYATKQWVEDKGYITGVDLTPYQEKSGMTAYQPVSSMTSYYTTGDANTLSSFFSGEIVNKLDISSFEAYTANDETYTLIGGKDIGISSDDVNKETTIYFTGSNGDEEVNNLVRSNSADWSNGGDSYTTLTSYSSTWNDITVYQSHSGDYITAHQIIPSSKWEDASDVVQSNSAQWAENTGDTEVNNFVYNNSASITSVNNSGALWNAVYDLVATYSAKWLINGDV